jgi:DNA repair protein RadC
VVGFWEKQMPTIRDLAVGPVAEGFRDDLKNGENPPRAAEGAEDFEKGVAAQEDTAVGLTDDDDGAIIGGGVFSELQFASEFSLERGEGDAGVFVEAGHAADGGGTQTAPAIEKKHPLSHARSVGGRLVKSSPDRPCSCHRRMIRQFGAMNETNDGLGRYRINDMPEDHRPREKLAALGPSALDNAELMALFFSTGGKGRSAIDIGRDLLKKYGSLGALGGVPMSELCKEKDLGMAKASKPAAAFELGARVARETVRVAPLNTPELIYAHFAPQLQFLTQEHVLCATLDARLRHTGTTVVSVGTVNESSAHPREILRPVITRGAYGFVLVHNHPSGDPSPSRADELVTRNLIKAADIMQVTFLDHVIIGRLADGQLPFYSFRSAGIVP